jgi:hypothetical protein
MVSPGPPNTGAPSVKDQGEGFAKGALKSVQVFDQDAKRRVKECA